ncbi:uncharacterized protein C8Q71DRAFT_790144 [Rhodofomes roseus]|uniref:Uncharacterized protein n=1 Tax=Rhodofomes roseus TaxID=34475 RepID=A0ABQ8JYT6_9APHY|nr:uncharacterized protein C8Q71DRAFT_790144 [Rhodofomes roseus]KAH9829435.1 hypothetical protein C8Q71DRAFT_790144 [Rhodofomes roseus]
MISRHGMASRIKIAHAGGSLDYEGTTARREIARWGRRGVTLDDPCGSLLVRTDTTAEAGPWAGGETVHPAPEIGGWVWRGREGGCTDVTGRGAKSSRSPGPPLPATAIVSPARATISEIAVRTGRGGGSTPRTWHTAPQAICGRQHAGRRVTDAWRRCSPLQARGGRPTSHVRKEALWVQRGPALAVGAPSQRAYRSSPSVAQHPIIHCTRSCCRNRHRALSETGCMLWRM